MDTAYASPLREMANRADALAMGAEQQASTGIFYLTFTTAGTTYAMNIASTKEVIEYNGVSTLPLLPPIVRGIVNLRGGMVPVIDLPVWLGFPRARPGKRSRIAIVEMRPDDEVFDVGIVVDGVSEVLRVDFDEAHLTSGGKRHTRSVAVEARARTQGRYVIMMHMEQVLSADEIAELSRVGETLDFCCTH